LDTHNKGSHPATWLGAVLAIEYGMATTFSSWEIKTLLVKLLWLPEMQNDSKQLETGIILCALSCATYVIFAG
jgi:hypothetical protein